MTSCCRSQSCSVVSSSGLDERQPGVVDDQVDAAERQHASHRRGLRRASASVDVRGDADRDVRAAQLGGGRLRLLEVEVGDDDARALGGEPGRRWPCRCRSRRR